ETQLIEKAQQPRLAGKIGHLVIAIPHLQSAADKLIAARAFHTVDAQIRPADAHRVFRRTLAEVVQHFPASAAFIVSDDEKQDVAKNYVG
ncbi:hypothetical protein AB721_18580, partial [Acinetobacter baumannii]